MSLEPLLHSLEEQSDRENHKIIEETQLELDQIQSTAQSRLTSLQDKILAKAREDAEIEEAKIIGQAKVQAHSIILEARKSEYEYIFQECLDKVSLIKSDSQYPQIFSALLQESLAGLSQDLIMEVSADDSNLAKSTLNGLGKKAEVKINASVKSGLIVKDHTLRLTVENTLESRLAKAWSNLTTELAGILWPHGMAS